MLETEEEALPLLLRLLMLNSATRRAQGCRYDIMSYRTELP